MPESKTDLETVDPAVWRIVWVVLIGALAPLFDTTIVAVGLHTLAYDLNAPVSTIQWVTTGYLLALGVVIPLTGWAQRVCGAKRLWMGALSVFLVGSILSSLAWSAGSLIAFRVVQGVGGGIMIPLTSTLVMQAAGGKGLGRIMSVVSLPGVLGPILGPVIGGLILQNLHWSWMFWVNVPFCVVGLVLAAVFMPKDTAMRWAPFDIGGFLFLSLGLVGTLFGLSNTSKTGGFAQSDVLAHLLGGVLFLVIFTAWSLHRSTNSLLDLTLLRHWPLASASILLFLSGITLYGAMLLLPLYFQQLRGTSVLEVGLLLIPQGLGTLASRSQSGKLSDAVGARWLVVAGFFMTLLGTLPFAYADANTHLWWLMASLFVRGVGLGAVTVPLMALGFRGLERTEVPDASIITRIASQVGGSFGGAVLIVILTSALAGANPTSAFHHSFWWTIGFTAIGTVVSLVLPGRPSGADGTSR